MKLVLIGLIVASLIAWTVAIAVVGHGALGAAILATKTTPSERLPDPAMIVDLPAGAAPAPSQNTAEPTQEQEQPQSVQEALPDTVIPRLPIPRVDRQMSRDPVAVPTPPPLVQRAPPTVQTRPQPAPPRQRSLPQARLHRLGSHL